MPPPPQQPAPSVPSGPPGLTQVPASHVSLQQYVWKNLDTIFMHALHSEFIEKSMSWVTLGLAHAQHRVPAQKLPALCSSRRQMDPSLLSCPTGARQPDPHPRKSARRLRRAVRLQAMPMPLAEVSHLCQSALYSHGSVTPDLKAFQRGKFPLLKCITAKHSMDACRTQGRTGQD